MLGVLHAFLHDGLVVWACVAACGLGYMGGESGIDGDDGGILLVMAFTLALPPIAIVWSGIGQGDGIATATFAIICAVCGAVIGKRRETARGERKARMAEFLREMRQLWEAHYGEAEGGPPWWNALWRELVQR